MDLCIDSTLASGFFGFLYTQKYVSYIKWMFHINFTEAQAVTEREDKAEITLFFQF